MGPAEGSSLPDNLLLFLSNKIIYKENGKFIIENTILSEIINNARTTYKLPEDTPVTLLSISGSPSNEKFLFAKSLVEYYEHGMKGVSLFADEFKPKTKELGTSGVYLVPKPFMVRQDPNRSLVWILYLYQSKNGAAEDIRLLERFLLLACSRIAEVKFEKEPFPLLQQWSELNGLEQRCDDFLYVFPTEVFFPTEEHEGAKLRSVEEGGNKLYYKMERCRDVKRDTSIVAKIPQVSVIEMKTLKKPLYNNFCQKQPNDQAISESLKQCIGDVHQNFKLGRTKVDRHGQVIQLGNLFDFWKDCVASALSLDSNHQALAQNTVPPPDGFQEEMAGPNVPKLMSVSNDINNGADNKKPKYNQSQRISQQHGKIQGQIAPRVRVGTSSNPNVPDTSPIPPQLTPVVVQVDNQSKSEHTPPPSCPGENKECEPSPLNAGPSPETKAGVDAMDQSGDNNATKLSVTELVADHDTTSQPTKQQESDENMESMGNPSADDVKPTTTDTGSHDGCQHDTNREKKDKGHTQDEGEGKTELRSNNELQQAKINADKKASHVDDGGNENAATSSVSVSPVEVVPVPIPTFTEKENTPPPMELQVGIKTKGEGEEGTSDSSANPPPVTWIERETMDQMDVGKSNDQQLPKHRHGMTNENERMPGKEDTHDDDSQLRSEGKENNKTIDDLSVVIIEPKTKDTESHDEGQNNINDVKDDKLSVGEDARQKDDEAFVRKLIPEVVLFYNDEMKCFLADDLYDPPVLKKIHDELKRQLTSQFLDVFKVDENLREKLRKEMANALDNRFPRHSQRNSENWKMKQAKISKCLQKMMSSYMEQIENVLTENPNGLQQQDLESKRDEIVKGVKVRLETEIRGNVREQEPMERHQDSLMAEINDYWDCVEERNNQNLKDSRRTEYHETYP